MGFGTNLHHGSGSQRFSFSGNHFGGYSLAGDWDDNIERVEADHSTWLLNVDVPFESFKASLDYLDGGIDSNLSTKYYELKFGYLLIDSNNLKGYLNLGYAGFNFYNDYYEFDGVTLSGDLSYAFSDTSVFSGSLGLSLNGEFRNADSDLLYFKLKYNYFFAESLGIGAGYHYYKYSSDFGDLKISGFNLGVTFKF